MQHKCLDRGGLFNDVMSNTSLKALHVSKLRLLTSIKEIQQINTEMYEPFIVVGFISSKRKTVNSASELFYIKKVPYLKLVLNRISKMLILHLNQRSCFSVYLRELVSNHVTDPPGLIFCSLT